MTRWRGEEVVRRPAETVNQLVSVGDMGVGRLVI